MDRCRDEVLVLGAGLAGLSAGHVLSRTGLSVKIVEKGPVVGGLSKTVACGPFRFDLGGHRFFTHDGTVEALVRDLLGPECLTVRRRSQILLRNRYIDYPLKPFNAISGLGVATASKIVLDNVWQKLTARFGSRDVVSLEDWVIRRFGRTLFEIYFRRYSEKVWGIGCDRISMDWVAQRIQGMSFGAALKSALFRRSDARLRTLLDKFLYPSRGIGMLSDRLKEQIEGKGAGEILCNLAVTRLRHEDHRIRSAVVADRSRTFEIEADAFLSTIPLTELVRILDPAPPAEILAAARGLRFRDIVIVAVMLDRDRATNQSWIYFPEQGVPFGRIHEPTNWSAEMAPAGKTLLVAEQFCFKGDATWRASDAELSGRTIETLERLGTISRREVLGTSVVRVSKAYPLFEVGYARSRDLIRSYLGTFRNLGIAGRGGTFSYQNMDHAMASGMDAAGRLLDGGIERLGEGSSAIRARRSA